MAGALVHIRIKRCPKSCPWRSPSPLDIFIEQRLLILGSQVLGQRSQNSTIIELEPHNDGYTCKAVEFILNTWNWKKGRDRVPQPDGREGCFNVAKALFHHQCSVNKFRIYANSVIGKYFQGDLRRTEQKERYSEKWAFIALVFGRHDVFYLCIRDLMIKTCDGQQIEIPTQWDPPLHESVLGFIFSRDLQVAMQCRASNAVNWYIQKLYRIKGQEDHAKEIRNRLEKRYKFHLPSLGPTPVPTSVQDASRQQHPEVQKKNIAFFEKFTTYHLYITLWEWFEKDKDKRDTGARGGSMNALTRDSASQLKERLFGDVKKWFNDDLVRYLTHDRRTAVTLEGVRESARLDPPATQSVVENGGNTPDSVQSYQGSVNDSNVYSYEEPGRRIPPPIRASAPLRPQGLPVPPDGQGSRRPSNRPLPAQRPTYLGSDYAFPGDGNTIDAEYIGDYTLYPPEERHEYPSPPPSVPYGQRHQQNHSQQSLGYHYPYVDGPSEGSRTEYQGSRSPWNSNNPANIHQAAVMSGALRPEPLPLRQRPAPRDQLDPYSSSSSSRLRGPPPRISTNHQQQSPAPAPTPPRTPRDDRQDNSYYRNGPPQLPYPQFDPAFSSELGNDMGSHGFEPGENFHVPGVPGYFGTGAGHGRGSGRGDGRGRGGRQYDGGGSFGRGSGGHGGGHV